MTLASLPGVRPTVPECSEAGGTMELQFNLNPSVHYSVISKSLRLTDISKGAATIAAVIPLV